MRQALLARRFAPRSDDPQAVIRLAARRGLLKPTTLGLVEELKRHWSVAVSTEPLPREAAADSLVAVRYILSIVPAAEARPARGGEGSASRPSDLAGLG